MRDLLKAVGCCLVAQGLFVLRARLSSRYFGDASVLALTSVAALAGGAIIVAARSQAVRQGLAVKTVLLAAIAAAFGLALHEALDLAGRELVGNAGAGLAAYAAPLVVVLVAVALRREALDWLRVTGVACGFLAVAWLISGPEVAASLGASPRGLGLLVLAAVVLAGFLMAAQQLTQAASMEFALAGMLLAGGAMTGALAGRDALLDTATEQFSSPAGALPVLALAGGMALAYGLLLASLKHLKVSTVGASFLTAAPWSLVYLVAVQGAAPEPAAQAGAIGALAAFGLVASRDRQG
jgi:drug/metabolite transporter (DMT)-like permease